jgi:hypothetical protein
VGAVFTGFEAIVIGWFIKMVKLSLLLLMVAESLVAAESKVQGFECELESEGNKLAKKSSGLLSCRWWYGERESEPKSPGWSVSLVAHYDPKKNLIHPKEIQCVKVP